MMHLNSGEIDLLLKDIHDYLKRRKEGSALSAEDQKLAGELIEKSKKQLEKIAILKIRDDENYDSIEESKKDATDNNSEGERYITMSNITNSADTPPALPSKNPVLSAPLRCQRVAPTERTCPFKELPAKQLCTESKQGVLTLRRKIFRIGHSSKVFGAIHESWLLIYWSQKDTKPFCVLDLKEHEAKEDEFYLTTNEENLNKRGDLSKNKAHSSFKVFPSNCTEKEKSFYTFVAATPKDMSQWVRNINRCHDEAVGANKGSESTDYEIFEDQVIEEENIYNEIDSLTSSVIKAPCPPSKSNKNSTEDIYQEVPSDYTKSVLESDNSQEFSDDDLSKTYDELATAHDQVKQLVDKKIKDNVQLIKPKKNIIQLPQRRSKGKEQLPKVSQSNNIVHIHRQRLSVVEPQLRNLETFSRNSKLETFQASPAKECPQSDFNFIQPQPFPLRSPDNELLNKKKKNETENEKPMVLLKENLMDEESYLKKMKKSPVIPVKPAMNRVVKKLNF